MLFMYCYLFDIFMWCILKQKYDARVLPIHLMFCMKLSNLPNVCLFFCCCSHACIIIPNISTSTFINSFLCVKEVMKNVYFIFNLCNLYFLSSKIPGRKNTNVGMHTLFRSVNNFLQKKSFAFQVPKKKGQYFLFYALTFCTDKNDGFDMTLRLR